LKSARRRTRVPACPERERTICCNNRRYGNEEQKQRWLPKMAAPTRA